MKGVIFMKLYVLIGNQYANLEYYDVCSTVCGVFSSKKNAIDYMYSFVKNEFNDLEVLYDEENDKYSLQDKDTKEIDECDIWYTIEEHELN